MPGGSGAGISGGKRLARPGRAAWAGTCLCPCLCPCPCPAGQGGRGSALEPRGGRARGRARVALRSVPRCGWCWSSPGTTPGAQGAAGEPLGCARHPRSRAGRVEVAGRLGRAVPPCGDPVTIRGIPRHPGDPLPSAPGLSWGRQRALVMGRGNGDADNTARGGGERLAAFTGGRKRLVGILRCLLWGCAPAGRCTQGAGSVREGSPLQSVGLPHPSHARRGLELPPAAGVLLGWGGACVGPGPGAFSAAPLGQRPGRGCCGQASSQRAHASSFL